VFDELDGLGDEEGTEAARNDAKRITGPFIDALRTFALFTDAEEIELTGIDALKLLVVIGVELNVPPTGAT
jgi:hypothetical protein